MPGQGPQTQPPHYLAPSTTSHNETRQQPDYLYYKEVFKDRPMPFAYLDLDLLDQNIREIKERAGGIPIRLASKSLRSVAVIKRILAADPCYQGIMCYTAREAGYLAQQGLDDLLIAYPCWHEQDIAAVARATAEGAHITLMIDSIAHIEQIEKVARQHDVRLPLCLDIDMASDLPALHFGVWRSPLRTPEQARPVIERAINSQHVWLDGVMGYEAQIAGLGDRATSAKNALIRLLKPRSMREVIARRVAIVECIKSYGQTLHFVNGGGTGSVHMTRTDPSVTEITAGSGFYSPTLFDNFQDFRHQPAAGFAIEIVRLPALSLYTCLGGGYTASGAAGPDKLPQPYLPVGARLDALEGAGEVQTPIRYTGPLSLALGDPIFLRHSKAGELCERFTHLLLVSNGSIVDEVTTYRGDGQCFL